MNQTVLITAISLAVAGCVQAPLSANPSEADPIPATPVTSSTLSSVHTATPSPTAEPTSARTAKPSSTPLPRVAFADEPAESSYQVPLTVQRLTPFEATLHFELDTQDAGWLLYRPELDDFIGWWALPFAEGEFAHQISLAGLTPGIRYTVQVGLGDDLESLRVPRLFGAIWGPIQFAAPFLGEPDLRFGVIGDSGFGDDQTRELIDLMHGYGLDFVIHTGDAVYKAQEESGPAEAFAVKYFNMFEPLIQEVPIYPVLGNHDYDPPAKFEGRPFFVRAFPALRDASVPDDTLGSWYAFERSGIQFIMLDSHAFQGSGGRGEQTAWLEERLADPGFRFSIPVFHTPPYTSGLHKNDGKALRIDWSPLFEAAGTPLVLSGHDHNYERIIMNDVTYVVSGGGSSVLYRESERVEGSQTFHRKMHFVLVEAYQDHLELTAIDLGGNVLDQAMVRFNSG